MNLLILNDSEWISSHTIDDSESCFVQPADPMVLEQPNGEDGEREQECVQKQIQTVDAMHEICFGVQLDVGGLRRAPEGRMVAEEDTADQQQCPGRMQHIVHPNLTVFLLLGKREVFGCDNRD